MKLYFLLRSNVESGPYTQKELREIGLAPSDLVWIEGESTSWTHPTEINGLKSIAKAGILKPLSNPATAPKWETAADSLSTNDVVFTTFPLSAGSMATNSNEEIYPLKDKERFTWTPSRPKINAAAVANSLFGLGVLMAGVMLFAFVIKKLVDHFEYEPQYASAQAIEISSEHLPVSTGSHAAMDNAPTQSKTEELMPLAETPTAPVANALATATQTQAIQKQEAAKTIVEQKSDVPLVEPETIAQSEPREELKTEEKETKPVAKSAPSLSLSANEYKVGMFGGISDLEITVNNPSSLNINKALVEVEFLKPNGSVVKSQTVSIENIAPGEAKKVSVPSSNRGVKVRYRVVSTDINDGKVVANDI